MKCLYSIVGTRWRHIGGRLKQIESGPRGACWGVNRHRNIYFRAGVTRRRPVGRFWVRIGGKLNFVSAGCSGVYGVSNNQQIWRYRGNFNVLSVEKLAPFGTFFKVRNSSLCHFVRFCFVFLITKKENGTKL